MQLSDKCTLKRIYGLMATQLLYKKSFYTRYLLKYQFLDQFQKIEPEKLIVV